MAKEKKQAEPAEADKPEPKPVCGIVMPISPTPGYRSTHWREVRDIIDEAAIEAGYEPKLVSEAAETSIIHKSIVTNLYSAPIIVCDISSKNPNVMFELGLRLAFDKPVVVIKDENTGYSFDTSPVFTIGYDSALRYSEVPDFKAELVRKIKATAAKESFGFLETFGQLVPGKIESRTVSSQEYLESRFGNLDAAILDLRRTIRSMPARSSAADGDKLSNSLQAWATANKVRTMNLPQLTEAQVDEVLRSVIQQQFKEGVVSDDLLASKVVAAFHHLGQKLPDEVIRGSLQRILDEHRQKG